jgi:hypothetical protein
MALGGARMTDSATIDGGAFAGGFDASGGALTLGLDIGSAIGRGFILAGGFNGNILSNPTLKNDTRKLRSDRKSQLSMLTVMAEGYPNPAGGFHVGGGLGLATLRDPNLSDTTTSSQDQNGFGFFVHAGYEWWVGNYWGLGGMARFIYAGTKGDYAGGTANDKLTVFALLFSATYN